MTWITSIFVFMMGKFNWESLLETVLRYGFKRLQEWLGTAKLSVRAAMFVQVVYLLAVTLGREWVEDTDFTKIDDYLVDGIIGTAKALSEKFNFNLPIIPQ